MLVRSHISSAGRKENEIVCVCAPQGWKIGSQSIIIEASIRHYYNEKFRPESKPKPKKN